jgi:uncharacterized integral membrane protein
VVLLVAGFAAINWSVLMAPSLLSAGFTTFTAPLGLIMLGAMAAIVLGFAIYMAIWQGTILMETRRHSRELQAQRMLADQAEASRFTELRTYMQAELDRLAARIAQSEEVTRKEVRDSTQSLSAYIGEMDDRLHTAANGGVPPALR